jgi:hypothetical protein
VVSFYSWSSRIYQIVSLFLAIVDSEYNMINLFVFNYRIYHCLWRRRVRKIVVRAFHTSCCHVHMPRVPSIPLQNLSGESVLSHWTVLTIQTRKENWVSFPHAVFMQIPPATIWLIDIYSYVIHNYEQEQGSKNVSGYWLDDRCTLLGGSRVISPRQEIQITPQAQARLFLLNLVIIIFCDK